MECLGTVEPCQHLADGTICTDWPNIDLRTYSLEDRGKRLKSVKYSRRGEANWVTHCVQEGVAILKDIWGSSSLKVYHYPSLGDEEHAMYTEADKSTRCIGA